MNILILAQIPRQDGFGDIFGGLLGQIPIILILQVCFAVVLLAGLLAFFIQRRRRRATSQVVNAPAMVDPPQVEQMYEAAAAQSDNLDDMPDLDLLLDKDSIMPERTARPGVLAVKLHTGQTAEAQEVLAILRDEEDGRLIVQMGDRAYRTLVDSPDAKKQFTQVMKELAEVVTQQDDRAVAVQPMPEPQPEPEVEPEATPEPEIMPEADVPTLRDLIESPVPPPIKKTAPPPPISPTGAMPGDLASYKLEDHPVTVKKGGLLGRQKFESSPVPELNIAASIEAYLQHKLRHSPDYTTRSIHILSAPGGGVRIEVDGTYYEAVGDIAETDVRQFLSETIQEWQERQ